MEMDQTLQRFSDSCENGSELLTSFVMKQYNYLFYNNEDPRLLELPLMNSIFIVLFASLVYLVTVCYALPKFMTGREPFQLKNTMIAYNLFQVVQNAWIITLCVRGGWFNGYSFICQPSDFSRSPQAMTMVYACWWYLLAKVVDWLDTVFFVLRKSYSQVSFLHVYHHIATLCWVWYIVRFIGGGHYTLLLLLNSFIHVLMYTYYLLSASGYHKYLWWKRYLTVLQMAQFVVLMIHESFLFFVECNYPKFTRVLALLLGSTLLGLFINFYLESYNNKNTKITIKLISEKCGTKLACLQIEAQNCQPRRRNIVGTSLPRRKNA